MKTLYLAMTAVAVVATASAADKTRIFILTDIGNEPDDA